MQSSNHHMYDHNNSRTKLAEMFLQALIEEEKKTIIHLEKNCPADPERREEVEASLAGMANALQCLVDRFNLGHKVKLKLIVVT